MSVLPAEEIAEILGNKPMPRFTKNTITSLSDMERELSRIRTRGYAVDQQENEPGVCCVAAPIADPLQGIVAAISVSGPTVRIREESLQDLGRQVIDAGRAIARYARQEIQ